MVYVYSFECFDVFSFVFIKMCLKCGLTIVTILLNAYHIGAEAPVLTSNATLVNVNETLQLTCTHPTITVVRWWRQPAGNSSISTILAMGYQHNSCVFVPTTIPDAFSTCVCNGTTFMCTLRSLDTFNTGDRWRCSVSINTQATFSNEITVILTVPVVYATLTPDVPTISVLPNVAISYIRCVSSEGRPAPSITWHLDNRTPFDYSDDVDITGNSNRTTVSDVTASSLTLSLTSNDHNAGIYCNVSNGYGQIMSNRTLKINVLMYPAKPIIMYNTAIVPSSISVIQNSSVTLECFSSGNPMPTILWTLFNGSLITSPYILLKVATLYNQEQIVCRATSVMDPTNGSSVHVENTTVLTVTILFAPETPTFTFQTCATYSQTKHLKVIQGQSVSGRCTSKSEPGSKLYWTPVNSGSGDGFVINNASRHHSGNYTCIANNEMNTTFGGIINGKNQTSFHLDVLAPAAALFIDNYTVLLNTNISVTCPYASGNPPETRFTWFYGNTSTTGSHLNLSLSSVQRSDEGYYKCRVNTTMEPTGCPTEEAYSDTSFYLDVQYPAKISRFYAKGSNFASSVTINESQTVTLLCEADSDPLAKIEIVNITKGDERLLVKALNNTISARVANARCEFDMGVYQCKGKNIYNAVQQVRELEIRITCSPRPSPFTPPIATAYRRRNSSAILSFTIVAYPPPNDGSAYVWRKQVDGEWAPLHNNRFQIRVSNDSLQTNLSISHLQIDDFTNYSVRVNNLFGSTEQIFVIRENELPSIPEQFFVVDSMVTQSSFTVQWTPGFYGGEGQWFVVGYKKAADVTWTYLNVSSTVSLLSIGELVPGTKYDVKMHAVNIIGKSDETNVLSLTTKSVSSDNGSSPPVGAAVGGAVGGFLAVVIFVLLWKYRNAFKRKPSEGAHYDDLFNRQVDVPAANTNSEYEAYRVESQPTNQYDTLAETSFHEYSVLSPGSKHEYSVMNPVSQVSENDRAIVNHENSYVNL